MDFIVNQKGVIPTVTVMSMHGVWLIQTVCSMFVSVILDIMAMEKFATKKVEFIYIEYVITHF